MRRYAVALAALGLVGCEGFGEAMTAHTDVVARVGEHELTVAGMVDLLAGNPRIPAQTEVVESVADLWVDYTILAELAATDTTLANVDLAPMMEPYVEQRTFAQLMEQVVTTDTVITDEELRQLYERQNPALRVRARHILLDFPEEASDAQRDSVRELAEQLRQRAVAGEDFAALAREHSDDTGSARRGGDLDWFGAGDMVKPFEDAAFALQPGEISPVVETLFGLHVIKVEERESPSFEEMGPNFRRQAVAERRQQSLDAYVSGLTEPANLEVAQGAYDVARDLARKPTTELRSRAASRELVTWDDGALTAGEFVDFVRRMPPQQRAQYAGARDDQLDGVLTNLATNELVLEDAAARGIDVPEVEQDSVRDLLRGQFSSLVREAGLMGEPQADETDAQAVERRVRSLLEGILSGRRNLLPLGALPYAIRQTMEWHIYERSFPAVVEALEERRDAQTGPPAPAFPMPGGDTSAAPPTDTTGG